MTKDLRISREVGLPLDVVTKTVAILAQRRKGKTHTASVMAEEMVAAGIPFVALDPTGAWWGLRSSRDGGPGGLPVVVLGGQHGDIPLDRTAGRAVADLVVDEPGWYIIDFSLFESGAAERQFATDFAERLYRRKGQPDSDFPLHLFVDEADRFVPQTARGGRGEARETDARMLGAFEAIVRRGGLRGLGSTLISQRAAIVNKNVLEQIDLLVVLRVVGPNDRNAIDNYLKADADDNQRLAMMGSLASLDIGEAWLWEPGGDPPLFTRVHIRERNTFNSSATPKPGQKRIEPKVFAAVDLDVIKDAMAATIERNLADDPKALRRRITELEHQIKTAKPVVAAAPVVEVRVERIEVPVLDEQLVIRLEKAMEPVGALAAEIGERLAWDVTQRGEMLEFERRLAKPAPAQRARPTPAAPPRPVRESRIANPDSADTTLPGPQRKLLAVLATYGPRTKRQLALQAGYSENGGGFNNPLGRLRSSGYATKGHLVEITAEGLAALGEYEPLPSGGELVDHWLNQLPGPCAKILSPLIFAWPNSMTKEALASEAGYDPAGGGFNNPLGKLRTLGLVTRGPEISLTDEFGDAISEGTVA